MTEETEEYDLEKSTEIVGQLYPVLLAKDGSVIDGNHRGKKWKTLKLDNIDTEEKKLIARAVSNWHRRPVAREEKEEWINGLAKIYREQVQGSVAEKIAEMTGLGVTTVRQYLSKDYKVGSHGGSEPRVAASQRIESLSKSAGFEKGELVERHREELLHDPEFQREVIKEIQKSPPIKTSCPVLPPLTPDETVEPIPDNYKETLTITCPKCGFKFEY